MERNAAGFLVASVDGSRCTGCGQCLASCPAAAPYAPPDAADPYEGRCLCSFTGFAADPGVRRAGQSGGVATALLAHLLDAGKIECAIATRWNPVTRRGEAVAVASDADVRSAVGSLYCQTAVVEEALRCRDRPLAVVALGCQARALAKLRDEGLFPEGLLIVGLVCEGNYSGDYIDDLCSRAGFAPRAVAGFRFKDKERNGWPGEVSVTDAAGRRAFLPAKARAALKKIYEAPCCLECIDKMNVAADIVVGDPWGVECEGKTEGVNVVVARTPRGEAALRAAASAGVLRLSPVPYANIVAGQHIDALRTRGGSADIQERKDFARCVSEAPDPATVRELRRRRESALEREKARKPAILVYGYPSDWNFGGPSIILGFRELVRRCRPDAEMVCYETAPLTPAVVAGYDFKTRAFPYRRIKPFWRDWFLRTFLRRLPKDPRRRTFWLDFARADAVVNLFGICFCSGRHGSGGFLSGLKAFAGNLRRFSPGLAARLTGRRSVKCTCSYGPATRSLEAKAATQAARFFFNDMYAREMVSAERLRQMTHGRVFPPVAPDVANLAPVPPVRREERLAGIVASFKMEQEWKCASATYVECMAALARHIRRVYGWKVAIVPNQDGTLVGRKLRRGDTEVARDILAAIPGGGDDGFEVVETLGRPALETKTLIARCTVLVSPRYHACVAALTAGVPLLTLGWHGKYAELAALYGQERWMVSAEECSPERLKRDFDALVAARAEVSSEILRRKSAVVEAVLRSGEEMLRRSGRVGKWHLSAR